MWSSPLTTAACYNTHPTTDYRIAGKFGGDLNLAIWRVVGSSPSFLPFIHYFWILCKLFNYTHGTAQIPAEDELFMYRERRRDSRQGNVACNEIRKSYTPTVPLSIGYCHCLGKGPPYWLSPGRSQLMCSLKVGVHIAL